PYRKDGKIEGYQLIRVRPHNIFYKIGFRRGDIIKGVNRQKIDSPETLARIWGTIKDQSKLIIDVERGGKSITFEVTVKGDAISGGSSSPGERISQNNNKAETQQKELNNMDKAMQGLRAGPYRKNGKIEGYRLIRVKPHNLFYMMGARSGDILKGINGHKIDSTETLMRLWGGIKNGSKLSIEVERDGNLISFDLNLEQYKKDKTSSGGSS
ncbi:MAG: PDZ domain-containing protein, partial [bacterium]|nr:PDZ domain-containing protein [bacterium]